MPNHCDGELRIYGAADEIRRFRELHGEELLDADKVIPYPSEFKEIDRKAEEHNRHLPPGQPRMSDGFNSGGYEWCVKNWGTKWGFYGVKLLDEDEETVKYGFQTAWGPPTPLIHKMIADFPGLRFIYEYWESGMQFQGHIVGQDGVVEDEVCSKYYGDRGG